MNRYALITEKMPREFLLLEGRGCAWKRCTFCDYHTDVSDHPFAVNKDVLSEVTGRFGILDIINSGSCLELDEATLGLIADIARDNRIHTLWFEAHWMYRDRLTDFAARFPDVTVRFRTGIETFDTPARRRLCKGIPDSVTAGDVARYFQGVCLLIGLAGQTREAISHDIETAMAHFAYFSVNAFVENTTDERRDNRLVDWFIREWGPRLTQHPTAEVLLNNTDLGVG